MAWGSSSSCYPVSGVICHLGEGQHHHHLRSLAPDILTPLSLGGASWSQNQACAVDFPCKDEVAEENSFSFTEKVTMRLVALFCPAGHRAFL